MKFPAFEPIDLKNTPASFEAVDLDLAKIQADKHQPRKIFSEPALAELAASIKYHGVIQPILVHELEADKSYQIIAGERRWRAAKLAGLKKIPAIIKKYDKANIMAISLIENIQRENLNPLEEAQAIQRLLEECYMTHREIADSLGRSRTTITNFLRLLTLSDQVKEMITAGALEMGHARALLSLSDEQQIQVAESIIRQSLSVRETEKIVRRLHMPEPASSPLTMHPSEFEKKIKKWNQELSKQFSVKAKVHIGMEGKGRVVMYFDSMEEADWLIDRLKLSKE